MERRKIQLFYMKVKALINNTRGSDTVNNIVISAILLIGIVVLSPTVRGFISDVWNLFSNFILGRLTTLFNS